MKITAISRDHSEKDMIALVTQPALTPQVFDELKRLMRTPASQSLSAKMVSGCLLIHSDRFTPELRAELEQLLVTAEDVVSGVTARKQAELDRSEKDLTLESAAAGFGLPIV